MTKENPMLRIEKAKRADAQAAWDIRKAAILDQCIDLYPRDALDIWTSGDLSESFSKDAENRFHLAKLEHRVIGTGLLDIEIGKIDAIFVHPD